MAKIYWDEEERDRIVQLVFSMRQNDPESSLVAIVNRAMSQLSPDRQRVIPSIKSIPWLADAIKDRFTAQRQTLAKTKDAMSSAAASKGTEVALRDKLKTMVDQARARALDEASFDDLVLALAARVGHRFEMLEGRVSKLEGAPQVQEVKAPQQPKKTVLVVGLLSSQANNVRSHFRTAPLALRFLSSDELTKGVPQADCAVVNTKFVSHKMQSFVQSKLKTVYLIHGGVTTVIDRIEQVLLGK